ncbi:SDR family oxidoreductase [Bradyrhizobium diazoefficiens]|nr:SDR family oxidoreductase [Bradyrhizobium diazoefficiens]MBR0776489.1 SDR family oxidoreductase [Bradyrhizobium diazoefficiens]
MRLFILGLGYSARHFVVRHGGVFTHIAGTARDPAKRETIAGIEMHAFSGDEADRATLERLRNADVVLVSIPPGPLGDPAIAAFADTQAAHRRRKVVYLSTIGVYGDHRGAWVDESTPPQAVLDRTRLRLAAEQAWTETTHGDAAILRLAGIYGPGRNALANLRAGLARRIVKPGQVFNRIHVNDIATAIMAAVQRGGGLWNVCDDEPAPPQDVIAYAAELMNVTPPQEEPFETAEMSAMARSFYASSARVSNAKLKHDLRITLACPTYRHGLDALWRAGEGR